MKKFNLFPVFLLMIGLLTQSCVNNPKQTASTMIILKDVDCQDCYEEISKIITSNKGIINYTIAASSCSILSIEPAYIFETSSEKFSSTTLRITLSVGVNSPLSIVNKRFINENSFTRS